MSNIDFGKVKLKKFNFKLTSEICFTLLLGMVWANTTLVTYLRAILIRIPYIKDIRETIVSFIFALLAILAIPYIQKHVTAAMLLTYMGICALYLLNFLFYPQNQEALELYIGRFLVKSLPLMFIGVSIDLHKHFKMLYYLSLIVVVMRFFHHIIIEPVAVVAGDMNSSYQLLPHVCMVLVNALNKRNFINIFVSVLGIFSILAYGSRGPVLCIGTLVISYMFLFKKIHKHPFVFSVTMIFIIAVVFWYEAIVVFLLELIGRVGLSTRILDMLLAGNIMDESGRDVIQRQLLEAISENWFGYGIAGDRAIAGSYSHNLLIELWVSYGVIPGTIMFVGLAFFLIKSLILRGEEHAEVVIISTVLFSSTVVKLFVSSSYLQEPLLFLLFGMIVAENKNRR